MPNSPTIVEAVIVRDIGVSLATLAVLCGTVHDLGSHRCYLPFFLSILAGGSDTNACAGAQG